MNRGKGIIALIGSLILLALMAGAALMTYSAGANGTVVSGLNVPPVFGGLLAVLLAILVIRAAIGTFMFPFFGGHPRWWRRRHHGWARHGWHPMGPIGHQRMHDMHDSIPPFIVEWHERLHAMESGQEHEQGTGD